MVADEVFKVGKEVHSVHEASSLVSTTAQPSFFKEGSSTTAAFGTPPLYSNTRVRGLPALPFTPVEGNSYVAPAREVLA